MLFNVNEASGHPLKNYANGSGNIPVSSIYYYAQQKLLSGLSTVIKTITILSKLQS